MSKRNLSVLAPLAAIVALVAIPAIAQATQLQINNTEAANNAAVKAQSENLLLVTETSGGKKLDEFKCEHEEFNGVVAQNQGTHVNLQLEESKFRNCKSIFDFTVDVEANSPLFVQIQKPDAKGEFVAHIEPDPGHTSTVQIRGQVQDMGASLATCDFTAPSVQLKGKEKLNVLTLEGTQQFTLAKGEPVLCGEKGTLTGSLTVTGGGNPVTVDLN